MPATTRITHPALPEPPALYLALELSNRSWKLAFSTGLGQKARLPQTRQCLEPLALSEPYQRFGQAGDGRRRA